MGDVGGGAIASSVAAVVPEEPGLITARVGQWRDREGPSGDLPYLVIDFRYGPSIRAPKRPKSMQKGLYSPV